TNIALPTGQNVAVGYDNGGRLSTVTLGRGTVSYGYTATTGQLASVSAPGGLGLAYAYNGLLPTSETWSGPVSGSVSRSYNSNFQTSSLSVDSANSISYQYDSDSLLT